MERQLTRRLRAVLSAALLGLSAASTAQGAVEVILSPDAPGCGDVTTGLAACVVPNPPGASVTVTWELDSTRTLEGYDFEVRWDPTEITLLGTEQLYPDTTTPLPFFIEPLDPAASSAVVLSLSGAATVGLFRLSFDVNPIAGPADADLWWFANGNGLAPAGVVLGNTGGAGIDFRADGECSDGIDNDLDGVTDLADTGCDDAADLSEKSPVISCDDGIDNDGDGRIDFDPVTAASPGNAGTPPAGVGDPGCFSPSSFAEAPECQDGLDNDRDGRIDYDAGRSANGFPDPRGADPQCSAPHRFLERPLTGSSCGLGFELVLVLVPLRTLRRRRSTRRQI